MSNKSTIKCPKCQHEFEVTDAFREEVQQDLNKKAKEWQLQKEEEFKKKEDALLQQTNETLIKQKQSIEENVKKSLSNDYENKLKILTETNTQNEEKLKAARQKELEFLKKEQALITKEAELEISLQKTLNSERVTITEAVRKQEQEKSSLKVKELEKQLDDAKKLAEEMQRKAEQGSMQLQGEVLELALEELLNANFPFDTIEEVAKGIKGADCIQYVKNNVGDICGRIIYESKRTKAFTNEWIEKLKKDMRAQQADIAILVTEVLPKDMEHFGIKDGIWICRFSEVKAVSYILRDTILKNYNVIVAQENKGEKMQLLYNYLTSNEFRQHVDAVAEGFLALREGIIKEKIQMEKIWKEREKQLDKVLLNTSQFYGSIQGIAGSAVGNLKMLE